MASMPGAIALRVSVRCKGRSADRPDPPGPCRAYPIRPTVFHQVRAELVEQGMRKIFREVEGFDEDTPNHHQVLGHPSTTIQQHAADKGLVLLLQAMSTPGWDWAHGGALSLLIAPDDLAAQRRADLPQRGRDRPACRRIAP